MNETNKNPGVCAVLTHGATHAETLGIESRFWKDQATAHVADATAARAALMRLIEACEPFARHNSSDPSFRVTHLSSEHVTALRAALAAVRGDA